MEALGVECTLESALNMAMIKEGLAQKTAFEEAYYGLNGTVFVDIENANIRTAFHKEQIDEYVKKMSFRFDCKCFWRTILRVLRRDGVLEDARE